MPLTCPFALPHTDLVLSVGYPLESYPVETWDGFILRLYRIPHGVKNATSYGNKPVVVLHHGVTLASDCFVALDTESSMGFYLADAGGWGARCGGEVEGSASAAAAAGRAGGARRAPGPDWPGLAWPGLARPYRMPHPLAHTCGPLPPRARRL
jgi:hypothetical protein